MFEDIKKSWEQRSAIVQELTNTLAELGFVFSSNSKEEQIKDLVEYGVISEQEGELLSAHHLKCG